VAKASFEAGKLEASVDEHVAGLAKGVTACEKHMGAMERSLAASVEVLTSFASSLGASTEGVWSPFEGLVSPALAARASSNGWG
jgi:hypothetical protein